MTQPLTPQQQPTNPPPPFKYARLLLTIVLIVVTFFLSRTPDSFVVFGTLITVLSVNFLEPVYTLVDRLDPGIERILKGLRLRLSKSTFGSKILTFGRKTNRILIDLILLLTILALIFHTAVGNTIGFINDSICQSISHPWCNSGIGVNTFNGIRIGLIVNGQDGGPFDQSGLNDQEKKVESLIFQENRTSCSGSHITLVVTTMLSRTIEDQNGSAAVGLENLRGAYIAQKDYNDGNPPPAVRLCLAIVNLGTSATAIGALPQVIQQIKQFSRHDPSFRGVVGMPYSSQVQYIYDKIPSWQQTNIPIVSPSATSDELSDTPNFYRVDSPDQIQGVAQAKFFCSYRTRLAKSQNAIMIDVFHDPHDPYSSSLSAGFERGLGTCNLSYDTETYTINNIEKIQHAVDDAIQNHDTFIFFAGYLSDQDTLENRIQENVFRNSSGSSSNMTILGGDGLYDFTNSAHNTSSSIYTTVYTYPLQNALPEVKNFIGAYEKNFPLPVFTYSIPSYTLLPLDAIRAYNAMQAFISTLSGITATPTQGNLNDNLAQAQFESLGTNFTFHGRNTATRDISDPNPIQVYIMCTDNNHTVHLAAIYGTDSRITLENGKGLGFCS